MSHQDDFDDSPIEQDLTGNTVQNSASDQLQPDGHDSLALHELDQPASDHINFTSRPTFSFPTIDEAAAHAVSESSVNVVVGDDEGTFESISLGGTSTTTALPAHSINGYSLETSASSDASNSTPSTVPSSQADMTSTSSIASVSSVASETGTKPSSTTTPTNAPELDSLPAVADTSSHADSTPAVEPPEGHVSPNLAPQSPDPGVVAEAKRKASIASRGASVLQKHVSMTRQRDLPPKDKEQERKHLRELEEMLAASKDAERRQQSRLEALASQRASTLAGAFPAWESAILPNWRAVLRPDANGIALRKLWWEGTMPVRYRGQLWGQCIGNSLTLGKSAWTSNLMRARKGVEEGRYPEADLEALLKDVEETLPHLKLFQKGGVMHDDLVDLLLAYSVYWPGQQPRYPPGLSYPAALLLVNMAPPDAFLSLINLVNKSFLKSFYTAQSDEEDAYYRIFDTLLADFMPKVYANFLHEQVRPVLYLRPWLATTFVRFLPLDLSTHLFDVFLLEGDSFLFRAALAILQILEPRLFNPVQSELAAVFRGQDKGAVAMVRREHGLSTEASIPIDDVYEEMGCTEKAVFDALARTDWKEETWDRLVARELPEAD